MLSSEIARKLLTLYLIVVSFTAFLQMGADKKRAKTGRRRIREKVLFFTAAIGGAAGACLLPRPPLPTTLPAPRHVPPSSPHLPGPPPPS